MQTPEIALMALDDLGPLADPRDLKRLLNQLPPLHPDARLLAGYVDGRAGAPGPHHWATLMGDSEYAAGFRAGAVIKGAS